eukprot:TRINITY_DN2248_c0_g1_i2.p1 TRINITY_DN2248_c0_g1~~TRINITY_DN2248_c0_g1_i2.p1  ORF type:complete len:229 (-),score=5.54 TRINITY_DN2248_c0_g1_i2:28-714(-)
MSEPLSLGILWDIDGTLCHSFQLGYSSTNTVLQAHAVEPISEAQYHQGTKYTTPRRLAWHATGDPDHVIGPQLALEFDQLYVTLVSPHTCPLYPGLDAILRQLPQSYPSLTMGALSNACTLYVHAVLQTNQLHADFVVALGADQVPAAKPAPDGLLLCCSRMNLAPSRCIYIGDSPSDGQAARAAGMKSIGVAWGSYEKQTLISEFTVVIEQVEQLMSAIQMIVEDFQ